MLEPLTLVLAAPAAKVVLEKFVEGAAAKLGEGAVEQLPAQAKALIQRLGQLLWEGGLQGHPGGPELLTTAEQGQPEQLGAAVDDVLQRDAGLEEDVRRLAAELGQLLASLPTATNVMNVSHGSQGLMVTATQEQPIIQIQGNPTLNFGVSEKK
ncbi:MAG: hypothetical protein ACO331_05920 [Prochlorothrix sp.]